MSLFSEVKPQWDNVGVEPSGAKKTAGWLLNEKPPAEWFNWLFNRNYKCIDELRTVVDALAVSSGAANTVVYGASATGNDSYVITPNPAIIAYNAGMVVEMYADVGNTAGATVNVSGKAVKTIKKITNAGKVALDTGDMIATGVYTLVYDGTDFILANPTAIPASLITAAGDLIYGSAANTPARLALTANALLKSNGTSPTWLPFDATANKAVISNGSDIVWGYPPNVKYTPSDTTLVSANTERTLLYPGNGAYIQKKCFLSANEGSVRIKCQVKSSNGATVYVAIRNSAGNDIASQLTTSSTVYGDFIFDVGVPLDKLIYIHLAIVTSGTAYIRNATMGGSLIPVASSVQID